MMLALRPDDFLETNHYLGTGRASLIYDDEFGQIAFSNPSSRFLPQKTWIELNRWCLVGARNGGSQQWKRAVRWLRRRRPELTTVVSYSDPSQGHTGTLYRACNWLWAPTWLRIQPCPTGNGYRKGRIVSPKDRWIFPLAADGERVAILSFKEPHYGARYPWAVYREPEGADYKAFARTMQFGAAK